MNPSFDIFSVIGFLGAVQGLFLVVMLLSRKGNAMANRFLALAIFPFSVYLFQFMLVQSRYIFVFPHLTRVVLPLFLLGPPAILFYTRILTVQNFKFHKTDILHFTGFFTVAAYMMPFYFEDAETKRQFMMNALVKLPIEDRIIMVGTILYMTVYVVICLARLRRHLRKIEQIFSSVESISLLWLRNLLYILLFSLALAAMFPLLGFNRAVLQVNGVIFSIIVYTIGFLGLNQVPVYDPDEKPVKRYESSDLLPERGLEYREKVVRLMESKKPFLESRLTLNQLADMLELPNRHLSQVINEHFKQNFLDFVNTYRVREAEKRLADPAFAGYSVLAVGLDVGFNSKSAFNAAFKKHSGLTPSELRKKHGIQDGA